MHSPSIDDRASADPHPSLVVHVGTVRDLDASGGVGVIERTDGKLVLVNRASTGDARWQSLLVGEGVAFVERPARLGPRAHILRDRPSLVFNEDLCELRI